MTTCSELQSRTSQKAPMMTSVVKGQGTNYLARIGPSRQDSTYTLSMTGRGANHQPLPRKALRRCRTTLPRLALWRPPLIRPGRGWQTRPMYNISLLAEHRGSAHGPPRYSSGTRGHSTGYRGHSTGYRGHSTRFHGHFMGFHGMPREVTEHRGGPWH